jgi:hypothetical protein
MDLWDWLPVCCWRSFSALFFRTKKKLLGIRGKAEREFDSGHQVSRQREILF